MEWEWDGRFGMVLAAFGIERAEAITAAVSAELGSRWHAADIAGAPPRVRELAKRLGGLRAGQWLWTHGDADPVMAVGAWWPWGGGQRASLRIGYDVQRDPAADARLARDLPTWFGLPPNA